MKAMVIRQWIAGLAFVVLLVVALVRTNSDIELTYGRLSDDAGPVVVQCLSGVQHLRSSGSEARHHRVLAGKDVLQERERSDDSLRNREPFNVARGIDDDCLRAERHRTMEVIWWIAGALLCAIAFAMARLRLPMAARRHDDDSISRNAPADASLERYRTRR